MMVLGSRAAMGYVLGRGAGAAGNGLLTGLVAYWGLDEASGDALDKHSGGLTLTPANSPGADTGVVYATARTFNGINQRFSRNNEAALQAGDIDFAFAAWAYSASSDNRCILAKYSYGTNNREFAIYYESSAVRFSVSSAGTAATLSTVTASIPTSSAWHLYIAWHDATADKIYLQIDDGTPAEQAHSGGAYVGASSFYIGLLNNIYYWNGRIGPVAFWKNRTLSADDRAALWNSGAGLAYSSFS